MKNILKTLALKGYILFLLGVPPFLSAQTPGGAPGFPSGGAAAFTVQDPSGLPQPRPIDKNSPAWNRTIKEVNFDGLPMVEVIRWLREQFPEVNFVNAPEVEDVPVRLTLRSVTLDDIFTALAITSKGELRSNILSEKMVSFFYEPLIPRGEVDLKKYTRAFSLANYLAGRSPEETAKALKELEEALKVSWSMLAEANGGHLEKPALNLHAPTKMLIVVGTPEQLEMVAQFIDQLRSNVYSPVLPKPVPPPVAPQPPQAPSPSTIKPGPAK